MAVLSNLLSPLSIAFIVIIFGYFIGRIKFAKISLDLSGVLIVAALVGGMLSVVASRLGTVNVIEYETNMNFLSSFGTALFVPSIGLSTGGMIDFCNRKDMNAVFIGSLMVFFAFAAMKIISVTDTNISDSKLLGVLCGALTSTPGLSAACELDNVASSDVVLGYGCTYLFGVIATVLFAQAASNKLSRIPDSEIKEGNVSEHKCALQGFIQISCVVVLGRVIGNIEIMNFSLGDSGGMLCVGIFTGVIIKKIIPERLLTTKMLTPFRNMGLALFFVGNGIPVGMQIVNGFEFKMIVYGTLISIVSIISGLCLYKFFFDDGSAVTTIVGGMTSTPAIGVLADKHKNISLRKYALSYFGALITIIVLIRFNFGSLL